MDNKAKPGTLAHLTDNITLTNTALIGGSSSLLSIVSSFQPVDISSGFMGFMGQEELGLCSYELRGKRLHLKQLNNRRCLLLN